jgi:hypothetical protein
LLLRPGGILARFLHRDTAGEWVLNWHKQLVAGQIVWNSDAGKIRLLELPAGHSSV